jgi:glutamate-1-semialdehyde 2,1-aminomutase
MIPVKASGAYIYDADGKSYIDYNAAFGPPLLGRAHPLVNRRVADAITAFDNVGVGVSILEITLARKLVQHVPSINKVLLCNSGSEATYHALRLSRAVTRRDKIIKFQGCYHGFHDSVATNVITPESKLGSLAPLSAGSLNDTLQKTIVCDFNDLESVETAIQKNSGQIAAIILEPIPHNIGCVLPQPGFLEGLRKLATQHGIILIFDEIITGFRHGLGGYQAICGVLPDLTTLGKAIANGFPIAAIGGRADLMDRFNTHPQGDVFFAGTFNGHPVGCAAALATIEILEDPATYEHLFTLGERMRHGLRNIMDRHDVRSTVAGFGSVFLTYFLDGPIYSYRDLLRNNADLFVEYRRRLVEKGIFKLPMNLKRNHISLSHTPEDIAKTLQTCDDTIAELKKINHPSLLQEPRAVSSFG